MNFDEIVVKESPGICRCCLSEGCYKDLGSEYIWMNEAEVYADMLLDCFDIGITQHSDGPNGAKRLICEVCITRLRDACNFKKQVLDSEKRFIDMLGRGEFRSKMVLFKPPMELKVESIEEPPEDVMAEDVEYLDDMEYEGNEEDVKVEGIQSTSRATTSEDRPLKRGRPKKDSSPTKAKRQKTVKDRAKTEGRKRSSGSMTTAFKYETNDSEEDIDLNNEHHKFPKSNFRVRKNLACILNNSTAMPFSYAKSKFNCFVCHEGFHSCNTLQQHFRTEHSNYKYNIKDNIMKRVNKSTSIKLDIADLSCKLCVQPFSDLKPLIDHFIIDHDFEYDTNALDIIQPIKLKDDDLRCHICDEKFVYFIKLVTHLNDFHEDKKYMCDLCGKSFKDFNAYNMHGWQVHGPGYNCPDCDRRCSSAALLREHLASNHGKGLFKCSECLAEFTSIYKRKKHIISEHNAKDVPASFKCPHCEKIFTCTSQRNVHVRKIHLQEKNEVCPICHAELFNKTRLKLHMVKHLRERNHVCDICGKKYQWKKNLKVHMQKHHNIL